MTLRFTGMDWLGLRNRGIKVNKMDEVKIVVDGLRNGMFENYPDLDEALLPQFEYLLSIIEQVTPFFEMVEEGQYPGEMNALEVASKYLKAIRGN